VIIETVVNLKSINMFNVEGTVKSVVATKTFGEKGFKKSSFVLVIDQQYDNEINFELVQENAGLVEDKHIGSKASVDFSLRGREYNGSHYVNLKADGVKLQGVAPVAKKKAETVPVADNWTASDDDSNLPF
jgi:hypothetical protein